MTNRSRTWAARALVLLAVVPLWGCGAAVRGQRLSSRPDEAHGIYLTTGGSPRPYRTLGFAQITGEGRAYGGVMEIGDAGFDGVIRGTLSAEAVKMGGDAVIHIEFLDENPQTDFERYQAAANTMTNYAQGQARMDERRRSVVVTGEIIKFIK
jgi:hypothetical protein